MAGITRDILGLLVLLWMMAGNSRWSCGTQTHSGSGPSSATSTPVHLQRKLYPSERHHVESVLSAVDGVQEVTVGDLRTRKYLQLAADTDRNRSRQSHFNQDVLVSSYTVGGRGDRSAVR